MSDPGHGNVLQRKEARPGQRGVFDAARRTRQGCALGSLRTEGVVQEDFPAEIRLTVLAFSGPGLWSDPSPVCLPRQRASANPPDEPHLVRRLGNHHLAGRGLGVRARAGRLGKPPRWMARDMAQMKNTRWTVEQHCVRVPSPRWNGPTAPVARATAESSSSAASTDTTTSAKTRWSAIPKHSANPGADYIAKQWTTGRTNVSIAYLGSVCARLSGSR